FSKTKSWKWALRIDMQRGRKRSPKHVHSFIAMVGSKLNNAPDKRGIGTGEERWRSRWREICVCCVSDGIPRRSFAVALIVGTILNLINQGDALFSGTPVDFTKIALTFAVPYCVATYG